MNISFFQTYGDRLPLLKIRAEDRLFQRFLNNFDLNIISLHGCSENVKNYVRENAIVSKSKIFNFPDISYCQCIQYLMNFLKSSNVSRFFFYQDDTFSYEITEKNIEDLQRLVFDFKYDLINLSYKTGDLIEKGKWTIDGKKIIFSTLSFDLFNTTTVDFGNSGLWNFDDSCFVCTYDRLKTIFDATYSFSDIWQAELFLKSKFENNPIDRYITNLAFFINYNILGRNTQGINIERLNNKIALTEETQKLLLEYYRR